MMSNFVNVFTTILLSTNFELGEHLLLSGWIDRYLLECPNGMVGTLTNVLLSVFEKCICLAEKSNAGSLPFQ